MIDVRAVSKRYGEKLAVDDLSFQVQSGVVTGFLGPNGAGKSTTMRLILGLDAPSSGTVRVNGCAYRDFEAPLHEIGAILDLGVGLDAGQEAFIGMPVKVQLEVGVNTSSGKDKNTVTAIERVPGDFVAEVAIRLKQNQESFRERHRCIPPIGIPAAPPIWLDWPCPALDMPPLS